MKRSFPFLPALALLLGVGVIAVIPHFVTNNYYLTVLSFVAIDTILAVGLNLLMGYAGQVSLGHAAFFGIGAYTSALLTTQPLFFSNPACPCWLASITGMLLTGHPGAPGQQTAANPWAAMVVGVIFTCLIALLVGMPCLRLRGHYLAMATLGFGWIVWIVMVHWEPLKGTSGIEGIPKLALGRMVFDTDVSRFYLTWTAAILILLVSSNIVNSRVGRALRALHTSEAAASALGVNIAWHKVQVFMLSAAFASIAGSLYAHLVNFISPSTFGFIVSVQLVVMVVIGGMASVWGAPVGAATITLLVEWLRSQGETFKDFDVIAHGAILVLVMIFIPAGLYCGLRDIIARRLRRRQPPVAPPVKEAATR